MYILKKNTKIIEKKNLIPQCNKNVHCLKTHTSPIHPAKSDM